MVAFGLLQYHPALENDVWCGKCLTERANVGKVKPHFYRSRAAESSDGFWYHDMRLADNFRNSV